MSAEFRKYLFPPDSPRITTIKGLDAYEYREAAKADPFTGGLIRGWAPLKLAEFRGVTEEGTLRPDCHPFEPARRARRRRSRRWSLPPSHSRRRSTTRAVKH